MSWQDNSSNEDGFKVYRWNGTIFAYLATVGVNQTSYTDNGLLCGQTYAYQVTAYNASGESSATSWINASTNACSVLPSVPSNPSPGDGATVDRTADTTFSWSTNGTSCDIHIWGGPNIDTNQTGVSCSSLHWGSQWPGSYQWQVTAHNSSGTAAGPTWHLNIRPYAPTNLNATTG